MNILPTDAATAATYVWVFALILGLIVSLVVTLLLWLIHRETVIIDSCASKIWDTGRRVANNTVHIPTLIRINERLDQILLTAVGIVSGAKGIEAHASGCLGCPHCMLEH